MFKQTYRGKKVLVTGHTGFKGSWLSQWLLLQGATVSGLSRDVPSRPSHFDLLGLNLSMASRTADIRDLSALKKILAEEKPEIVFHLAAQPLVRAAYDDPKYTFDTNLGGVINILEAIRGCPSIQAAIVITSDKCYENVEWDFGYRETDRLGGKDPYSASKACAEIAFSCYARSFFRNGTVPAAATGRAGNVVGGGDWAADRIVPDCVRAWTKGAKALIRNPSAVRPWQHVLEPLSGYLWLGAKLLEGAPEIAGEAFNFGPAPSINASVEELLKEMARVWQGNSWTIEQAMLGIKQEASLLKLNCDKTINRLQWRTILSFEETAEMTARWYMNYYLAGEKAMDCTVRQIHDYERLAAERGSVWAKS